MKKEKLEKLANEKNYPCVTISMNTNRTYPDNQIDIVVLKILLIEAKERVLKEFGKHLVKVLIEKINNLQSKIDINYNLDSLHIFLSNSTMEIVRSTWPTMKNEVVIAERFAIKPLIKLFNRTEEYLILILSQSFVRLLLAVNDSVVSEIKNDDFPSDNNPPKMEGTEELSNKKQTENQIQEFFNKIDKGLVKVNNQTDLKCVVVSTNDNYNRIIKMADKPNTFMGWTNGNHDNNVNNSIAIDTWKVVNSIQKQNRADAIKEMQEAVGKGKVITDLSEIYRAAKDGRGDLLIVNDDFKQAVKIIDDFGSPVKVVD